MPKIIIREKDFTGSEALEYQDYTVLVPGVKITNSKNEKVEGLFTTSSKFIEAIEKVTGETFAGYNDEFYDKGIIMANELLKIGLPVYYTGAYSQVPNTTGKRSSSNRTVDGDWNIKQFTDKGKYDLRFITTGGIDESFGSTYERICGQAIGCAATRGDAVAVLSVPEKGHRPAESGESGEYIDVPLKDAESIDAWVNGVFGDICNTVITKSVNEGGKEKYGKYAAMFAPNCVFPIQSNNEKTTIMPAAFAYLSCFGTYVKNYASWFAMCGSVRGVTPYSYITPTLVFGDADIDIFQKRDVVDTIEDSLHVATNAICEIRPYGNIVWGNRTMHPLDKPEVTDASELKPQLVASSFLNIRHLCSSIKKQLYRSARKFTFEPNSDVLWIKFKDSITPLLDEMKNNQGIKGYQIIKVKTNKKAVLKARIRIIPIEAVEDFDLTVELTDSIDVNE